MFDDKLIQKQYEEYKENYVEPDAIGRSMMRDRITEDLSFVSQMSVEEYTLYSEIRSMGKPCLPRSSSTELSLQRPRGIVFILYFGCPPALGM